MKSSCFPTLCLVSSFGGSFFVLLLLLLFFLCFYFILFFVFFPQDGRKEGRQVGLIPVFTLVPKVVSKFLRKLYSIQKEDSDPQAFLPPT